MLFYLLSSGLVGTKVFLIGKNFSCQFLEQLSPRLMGLFFFYYFRDGFLYFALIFGLLCTGLFCIGLLCTDTAPIVWFINLNFRIFSFYLITAFFIWFNLWFFFTSVSFVSDVFRNLFKIPICLWFLWSSLFFFWVQVGIQSNSPRRKVGTV